MACFAKPDSHCSTVYHLVPLFDELFGRGAGNETLTFIVNTNVKQYGGYRTKAMGWLD